jgi:hypothetical protein
MIDSRVRTYRKNFVANARVPNIVYDQIGFNYNGTILDFGCGYESYWPQKFRKYKRLHCDGFDLVEHKYKPTLSYYDLVMVSNVLNVQETREQLNETINKIVSFCCKPLGSLIVWNYPETPRKMSLSVDDIKQEIKDVVWQKGLDCDTRELEKNVFETIIK